MAISDISPPRRITACVQPPSSCRSSNVVPRPPQIRAPPTQAGAKGPSSSGKPGQHLNIVV
jgi:hypothetical protein